MSKPTACQNIFSSSVIQKCFLQDPQPRNWRSPCQRRQPCKAAPPPPSRPPTLGGRTQLRTEQPRNLLCPLQPSRRNANIRLKSETTFQTARRKSTPRETARFGETTCKPVTFRWEENLFGWTSGGHCPLDNPLNIS